jgi:hypothetical protein
MSEAYTNPAQLPPTDLAWTIRAAGDINNDGQTDLIWEHETTLQLSAWLMNGLTVQSSGLLTPSSVSSGWKIVGPK